MEFANRSFRLTFAMLVVAIIGGLTAFAGANVKTPQFADYMVRHAYHGKVAEPLLVTAHDREFRTMIRNGAKGKPDFAGYYRVVLWGCGAGCVMGVIVDLKSGLVSWIPFSVSDWPESSNEDEPVSYRLNSRLIIVHGQLNEAGSSGAHYFVFDDHRLKAVR